MMLVAVTMKLMYLMATVSTYMKFCSEKTALVFIIGSACIYSQYYYLDWYIYCSFTIEYKTIGALSDD